MVPSAAERGKDWIPAMSVCSVFQPFIEGPRVFRSSASIHAILLAEPVQQQGVGLPGM